MSRPNTHTVNETNQVCALKANSVIANKTIWGVTEL